MIVPGTILGNKYVVERVLGEGGMGVVVAALHQSLGHRVAIKMMLPEASGHPEMLARFEREARAAAGLSSEHVARVTDVGYFDNGMPYMVMEFLEGEDVEQCIRREKQLPVADAVRYFIQACIGLGDAHTHGLVHRDVKPSNIFLARRQSGRIVVKILDFGIAKAPLSPTNPALTRTTVTMGSPLYMSPEQLADAKSVDHRTDIWSLGAAFYEALTGQPAFLADTLALLHAKILMSDPAPPSSLRHGIPADLEMVLLNCLEKDAAKRYSSIAAVQRDLERIEERLSGARPLVDTGSAYAGTSIPPTVESPEFLETSVSNPRPSLAPSMALAPQGSAAPALRATADPSTQTYGDAPARKNRSLGIFALGALGVLAVSAMVFLATRTPMQPSPAEKTAVAAPRVSEPPPPLAVSAPAEEVAPAPALEVPAPAKPASPSPRPRGVPARVPVVQPVAAPVGQTAAVPAPPAEKPTAKKKRTSLEPEAEE